MKEKLRNMYEEGLLDTTGLLNAVAKDWITKLQERYKTAF